MKYFFLTVFLPFVALSKTEAIFVDSCSKKEIRVATPNGTNLLVKINHFNPQEDLELKVTFKLAGITEKHPSQDSVTWNILYKKKYLPQAGPFEALIKLPKIKWMRQVEERHQGYRIWDADLSWIQSGSKKAGYSLSSFYHAPSKGPYYQLRSAGICHWEEPAQVASKLYENNSDTWMNVTRESSQTWDQGPSRGMSLGYNNNTGGTLPLAPSALESTTYGWFFKDWQNQLNTQHIFRVERKYLLTPQEAGVFISHLSFTRHLVDKVTWKESQNSCGKFVIESQGHLDVGVLSEDFLVIPRTYFGREDKLTDYIQTVRPAVNNCPSSVGTGAEFADDIIPSGNDKILFYYKNYPDQGEI